MEKKDRSDVFALFGTISGALAAAYYCYSIVRGSVEPPQSTWVIFAMMTTLGYGVYLMSDGKKSLIGNAGNVLDLGVVWAVLASVLFRYGWTFRFGPFDVFCFAASFVVLSYWGILRMLGGRQERKNPSFFSFVLLQVIMSIAYLPTYGRLWHSEGNTESLTMWGVSFLIAGMFFISSKGKGDRFGMVYAGRAFVCTAIVLLLMLRLEFR